jgi:CBS domain-containing protein
MMSKDVKVEAQNQNIFAVAKIMSDNDIGSVIIIDNHENRNPVGIVTERDIFKLLMKNKDLLSVISNENTNIAQKPIYNDFINFWFNDTQPKR